MINEEMQLSLTKSNEFISLLKARFGENMIRHVDIKWENVKNKILLNKEKLITLYEMVETGGEPDVIFYDLNKDEYTFVYCSEQSPKGRRTVCYDNEALQKRKQNKPNSSAIDMANELGIELLTEEEYRKLQQLGNFDTKTSSWVKTPDNIRKLGGAIFCDCRYDTFFTYHNGAESYYSSRGFRGSLTI